MTPEQREEAKRHRSNHVARLECNRDLLQLWRISDAMDYAKTPREIMNDPSWGLLTIEEFWAFQKIKEKEFKKETD